MELYHTLSKAEIQKKYGLSKETFDFYVRVGLIKKVKGSLYQIDVVADNMQLEKNTVFKYCFDDNWVGDIENFIDDVRYSSKVKTYSPEEIAQMNKRLKGNE